MVSHGSEEAKKGRRTARIWVYLPVFVEGLTAQQNGQENGDIGNPNHSEANVDASLETEAVLQFSVSISDSPLTS
jgi:hypothetical protein